MRSKITVFRVVLILLLLAALACNAVTNAIGGSDSRVDDAQATADTLSTEAAIQLTAASEQLDDLGDLATPDIAFPDDDDDPADAAPTDDSGDDGDDDTAEPAATDDIVTGFGDGPDDVPVFEGNNENFFASDDVVTYLTDASYADVVAFYKTEMEANGWSYNASLSTEFGEIAALTYTKDNRSATVSILTDTSSGQTLVAVNILPN
jgi:hypothetical protein